ncbi:26S proteasome non-ATPase regulatory subunit 9 [Danaus plexippus]|uniref:26S proteasome non-ATPase regulatory subunit 9 n=1 Tax=Danaus plexippus TaxID=13037 RepID=UPI002AB1CEE6|nr:26S proteasome non-ATPase regulatory subunit 9 [Danaus plexippus]
MVGFNMDGPARDRVMKLIQEKDRIESIIRDQNLILEANNVGMQDSLVDADGFPRNDIDVYKVRHARHQIICLQNDHKKIMKEIEKGLGEVHADFLGTGGASSSTPHQPIYTNGLSRHSETHSQTFAKVGPVQEGSPADLAGLCEDDELLQFGSVNHGNFTDITQLHSIVVHSVGQAIQVRVQRQHIVVSLNVVPRPWARPGLLGCQIQRLS